jgi:hypothetical protein
MPIYFILRATCLLSRCFVNTPVCLLIVNSELVEVSDVSDKVYLLYSRFHGYSGFDPIALRHLNGIPFKGLATGL